MCWCKGCCPMAEVAETVSGRERWLLQNTVKSFLINFDLCTFLLPRRDLGRISAGWSAMGAKGISQILIFEDITRRFKSWKMKVLRWMEESVGNRAHNSPLVMIWNLKGCNCRHEIWDARFLKAWLGLKGGFKTWGMEIRSTFAMLKHTARQVDSHTWFIQNQKAHHMLTFFSFFFFFFMTGKWSLYWLGLISAVLNGEGRKMLFI